MGNEQLYSTFNTLFLFLLVAEFILLYVRAWRAKLNITCIVWLLVSSLLMAGNFMIVLQFYFPTIIDLSQINDKAAYLRSIINLSGINALPSLLFWYYGIPYSTILDWRETNAEQRAETEEKKSNWQHVCLSCVLINVLIIVLAFLALKTKI